MLFLLILRIIKMTNTTDLELITLRTDVVSNLVPSFKISHLAKLDHVGRDTIKNRTDLYLPVRIDTYETARSSRGYGIRYIRVADVKARLGA
jgi:hypothetical protein